MRNEPTFYQGMDWYGLVELGPAAREVLNLLLTSCRPGRKGHVEHSVHVMATWFPEVTRHWGTPMTSAKARRGLAELIEKGVLTRHNDPKDGSGFVVTFNMNPPQHSGVPVNGFQHAEEVAERCGARAVFRRINDDQNDQRSRAGKIQSPKNVAQVDPFSDRVAVNPDPEDEDTEFDLSGLDSAQTTASPHLTSGQQEFAAELEIITSNNPEEHLRLMAGQCARIAEAVQPALERGWESRVLAKRLAGELNPKIHSPEALLKRKAGDLGAPPVKPEQAGEDVLFIKGRMVDVSDYDPGFGYGPASATAAPAKELPGPSVTEEPSRRGTKEERLAELARKHMRRG